MSDDIDFGLSLGLPGGENANAVEKVVAGPWSGGADAEAKVKAANGEAAPAKKKSAVEQLGALEDKVKEKVAARMLAQFEEVLAEGEEMSLEDRLAKLAMLAKRYTERPAFKIGDLVTPISAVQSIADAGEPHIVLEWHGGFEEDGSIKSFVNSAAVPGNSTEDVPRQIFGNHLDMRVIHVSKSGAAVAHWVESSWYQYWTPPVDDTPEGAAA